MYQYYIYTHIYMHISASIHIPIPMPKHLLYLYLYPWSAPWTAWWSQRAIQWVIQRQEPWACDLPREQHGDNNASFTRRFTRQFKHPWTPRWIAWFLSPGCSHLVNITGNSLGRSKCHSSRNSQCYSQAAPFTRQFKGLATRPFTRLFIGGSWLAKIYHWILSTSNIIPMFKYG